MSRSTTSTPADGYGDLIIWRCADTGRIEIAQADPRIRLDVLMIAGFRDVKPDWATYSADDGALTLTDDFGHRYIYRVDLSASAYDPATRSFPAEWPD